MVIVKTIKDLIVLKDNNIFVVCKNNEFKDVLFVSENEISCNQYMKKYFILTCKSF